ncbi:MAG: HPr family phosphocarrier protein [Candidatus Omnitrophota bacterium]
MVKKEIIVKNKLGLHARPAALFVQIANKFEASISVIRNDEKVNGKSIMGILMLGVEKDTPITIEADGQDAELALVELEKLVSSEEEL